MGTVREIEYQGGGPYYSNGVVLTTDNGKPIEIATSHAGEYDNDRFQPLDIAILLAQAYEYDARHPEADIRIIVFQGV